MTRPAPKRKTRVAGIASHNQPGFVLVDERQFVKAFAPERGMLNILRRAGWSIREARGEIAFRHRVPDA